MMEATKNQALKGELAQDNVSVILSAAKKTGDIIQIGSVLGQYRKL